MGQSMTSNGLVAHPAAQRAAAIVATPLDGPQLTTENAARMVEGGGEDSNSTPSTELDGDQDKTLEEWAADEEQDYDSSEGFYPQHLFVPGMGPGMERRYHVQRLSGLGFDLVPYAPSDAAMPAPTGPEIPQLVLTTEEGEQFSLWDPVRYDYDFYRGRFHYYCLDTEDDEAEALEEEK
ncbi:hypothetical protein B0T18DRAFT_428814 [Schizothecium vesticola]|uniref:Uncharacterized protein n=1 Tax=Schizothecium vesticola TaxID=314040 RepID=A0AA40K4K8_9PEZI|nr:hypothetical protein B0T18DRAFT_428814 [Schizothecium vesticola]